MKKRMQWVLLIMLVTTGGIVATTGLSTATDGATVAPHTSGAAGSISEYVIGPGDVLEISVWKEPDLTKLLTVLPDGSISFPLIGQFTAEGLTLEQLKKKIEKKIQRFVPNPNLSVVVHQINSLHIYVVGKVNKPGRFSLNANVNVLQTLAMAGGLNPFAKKDRIKIFRQKDGQDLIFEFDYEAVSKGEQLEQNIQLIRGDVVVVP